MVSYWSTIAKIFIPHLYLARSKEVTPSKFPKVFDIHKTKMIGLPCDEETMKICYSVFIEYRKVTDGETETYRFAICSIARQCADAR